MEIIQKPSPNFYANRNGQRIRGICNHISVGTLSSMDAWFHNPESNASSNFGIGRDGTIHQYVQLSDGAWTQGISHEAIGRATAPLIKQVNINPNTYLASIEHEGYEGNGVDGDITDAQFLSTCLVHKYIQDFAQTKYGVAFDLNSYNVLGHFQIDPVRKPFCPGKLFPWARLYSELAIANSMPLDAYEERINYLKSQSANRALGYAFAERISDLGTKLTDPTWGVAAATKLLWLSPIMPQLDLTGEITPESIVKRVSEIYKNSSDARYQGEGFRKLLLGANMAKTLGLL
jgi:N-acetylmuramoyl-L-alanine amidase